MKLMTWLVVAGLMAGPVWAAAETAQDIIRRSETQKVAALQEYLKTHPDAADAAEATDAVIGGLMALERDQEAVPLLLKKYDRLMAEKEAPLPALFGEAIRPLVEIYGKTSQRAAGATFLDRVLKDLAANASGLAITQTVAQLKGMLNAPQVGESLAIQFTATDDRKVSLAGLTNKVVLVDFWASWCGPCRAEMPNVVSAYGKFHDKGFEVIGISLDEDREAMDAYVKAQKLAWPQYFDGKGWESELVSRSGVTVIPATFLIGKDGKIAAKNVSGDALQRQIAELLAAK